MIQILKLSTKNASIALAVITASILSGCSTNSGALPLPRGASAAQPEALQRFVSLEIKRQSLITDPTQATTTPMPVASK